MDVLINGEEGNRSMHNLDSVECDVLPEGVILKVGNHLIIGTAPKREEKESV